MLYLKNFPTLRKSKSTDKATQRDDFFTMLPLLIQHSHWEIKLVFTTFSMCSTVFSAINHTLPHFVAPREIHSKYVFISLKAAEGLWSLNKQIITEIESIKYGFKGEKPFSILIKYWSDKRNNWPLTTIATLNDLPKSRCAFFPCNNFMVRIKIQLVLHCHVTWMLFIASFPNSFFPSTTNSALNVLCGE